jgi:Tfp pilus assembly protein PilN
MGGSGKLLLRNFGTVPLQSKFEEKPPPKEEAWVADNVDMDAFVPPVDAAMKGGSTNAPIVLDVLNGVQARNYTISFAISEPSVSYVEFENDFGLSGAKLKRKILQEIAEVRTQLPDLDAIATIDTSSGGLLSIIREGGLQLYDLLSELKPSFNGRLPAISCIETVELSLMEFVRANYNLREDEITVIVYVGHDFSRVVFMKGPEYLHLAPMVSDGVGAPNITETIYNRIRLSEDDIPVTKVNKILLAGESYKVNLQEALASRFPQSAVEYLQSQRVEPSENQSGDVVSEYVIPIAVAQKTLQPQFKGAYDVNLIPTFIVESQEAFRLAWHGWAAAGLLVLTLAYFLATIIPNSSKIALLREALNVQQVRLAELDEYRTNKRTLLDENEQFENALRVYNAIVPGTDHWSRILDYLAVRVKEINSLWIYSIRTVEKNPAHVELSGRAFYRSRVSQLVNSFNKASLLNVRTVTIRNRDLFEFDILVESVFPQSSTLR